MPSDEDIIAFEQEARADAERNAPPKPYDWRDVLRAYGRAIYLWFCE